MIKNIICTGTVLKLTKLKPIEKLCAAVARALVFLSALGLILMTLVVGWQVFGRYILNQSPDWSEQAALVLMIWYICLASAAGVHENFHIRIVFLENKASPPLKKLMRLACQAVTFLIGLAMGVYGLQLVTQTWGHAVPTLPITRGMVYLALPIGGFLIALFSAAHFLKLISTPHLEEEVA